MTDRETIPPPGCNQTETLLGKMKITQKKGAELFHPLFLVSRLKNKFDALRKKRPQSVKLKSSQSGNDAPRNNSAPRLATKRTPNIFRRCLITQNTL